MQNLQTLRSTLLVRGWYTCNYISNFKQLPLRVRFDWPSLVLQLKFVRLLSHLRWSLACDTRHYGALGVFVRLCWGLDCISFQSPTEAPEGGVELIVWLEKYPSRNPLKRMPIVTFPIQTKYKHVPLITLPVLRLQSSVSILLLLSTSAKGFKPADDIFYAVSQPHLLRYGAKKVLPQRRLDTRHVSS